MQRNHRNISVHDDTYETLKQMGAITESFDDVVRKLIEKAAGQQPLVGTANQQQSTITLPSRKYNGNAE